MRPHEKRENSPLKVFFPRGGLAFRKEKAAREEKSFMGGFLLRFYCNRLNTLLLFWFACASMD